MVVKLAAAEEIVHVGVMVTAPFTEICKGGEVVDEDGSQFPI